MKTYNTSKLAKRLGVARDSLYRWLNSKLIPPGHVEELAGVRVRVWTERDLKAIKQFMRDHPRKGRGQKKAR